MDRVESRACPQADFRGHIWETGSRFELGGHSDPGKLEAGFELTDHSGCMNRVEALQQ